MIPEMHIVEVRHPYASKLNVLARVYTIIVAPSEGRAVGSPRGDKREGSCSRY